MGGSSASSDMSGIYRPIPFCAARIAGALSWINAASTGNAEPDWEVIGIDVEARGRIYVNAVGSWKLMQSGTTIAAGSGDLFESPTVLLAGDYVVRLSPRASQRELREFGPHLTSCVASVSLAPLQQLAVTGTLTPKGHCQIKHQAP